MRIDQFILTQLAVRLLFETRGNKNMSFDHIKEVTVPGGSVSFLVKNSFCNLTNDFNSMMQHNNFTK